MKRRVGRKLDRPISRWQKAIVFILTFALLFTMAGVTLLRNSFTVSADPAQLPTNSPNKYIQALGEVTYNLSINLTQDTATTEPVTVTPGTVSFSYDVTFFAEKNRALIGGLPYLTDFGVRDIGEAGNGTVIGQATPERIVSDPDPKSTTVTVNVDGLRPGKHRLVPTFTAINPRKSNPLDTTENEIFPNFEHYAAANDDDLPAIEFEIGADGKIVPGTFKAIKPFGAKKSSDLAEDTDCQKLFPSNSQATLREGQAWNNIKLGLCSVLFGVIGGALGDLAEFVTEQVAEWAFGAIEQLKKGELAGGVATTDKDGNTVQPWDYQIWQVARGAVDIILVIALIIIAFANILHIQLDTYTVKKILGPLIGAAIAANLSWWLLRVIVAFAANIPFGLIDTAKEGLVKFGEANGQMAAIGTLIGMFAGGPWVGLLVGGIMVLLGVGIAVFLAFMLFLQPFILSILVAAAPVAIMGYALPPLKGFFDKWVKMFINWAFMSTVLILIFTVMNYLPDIKPGSATGAKGMMTMLMIYVLYVGLAALAARVPFTMGGDISAGWFKASKWLGGRAGNRLLYKAVGAQVSSGEAKKRYDAAGAKISELNAMSAKRGGLTSKQKTELEALQKERKKIAWSASNISGRLLAPVVSAVHPRAIIEGMKAREAGQEEAIMGLLPAYSRSFADTAGKAVVYKNTISGEMYKARNASPQKVLAKVEKLLKDNNLSDEEIAYFFSESEGGFPGKLAIGAILKKVSGSDAAELRAWLMQLAQNARMQSGGRLQSPEQARFAAQHKMLNYFGMDDLALANMAGHDGEKVITDQQLEEELTRRFGAEQVERYKAEITDIQRVNMGRRKGYLRALEEAEREEEAEALKKAGGPAGAEAGPPGPAPAYDPGARAAAIMDEELKNNDSPSGEATRQARAEVNNVPAGASPVQQVEVVNTVPIETAAALPVVDEGARAVAREHVAVLKTTMQLQGETAQTQEHVLGVVNASQLTPEAVGVSMEEAIKSVPRYGDTRLTPKSEGLLQKVLVSSVRGDRLVTNTAQEFSRENLMPLREYTGPVSEQIRSGKLPLDKVNSLISDIDQRTEILKSAGESAALEVSEGLKKGLTQAGMNITGVESIDQLRRYGDKISVVLQQVARPEVKDVLTARDYTPEKMHEAIVQQTARDLVRSMSLQQISNAIKMETVAGVAVPPEEKKERVEVQVGSFIRNSTYAREIAGLTVPRQRGLIQNVSGLLLGRNIEISDVSIDNTVREALTTIATGTQGGPQQPPPSAQGSGAARPSSASSSGTARPPQTPPATPPTGV